MVDQPCYMQYDMSIEAHVIPQQKA